MKNLHGRLFVILSIFAFFILLSCYKDDDDCTPVFSTPGTIGLVDTSLWDPPAYVYHIDPTAQDYENADGSIDYPYNSFDDFKFKADCTYAIKRGTTLTYEAVSFTLSGITICSYGDSEDRPVLKSTTTDAHAIKAYSEDQEDLIIRDLEVYAPDALSCIVFGSGNNLSVINCLLHGAGWGFRAIGTSNVFVYNTEIHTTLDDGMFLARCNDIEISNCYIHDVNQNWEPPETPESEAGGDAIQFQTCDVWHVHHNYLDRTNSGNKFCFISNNTEQKEGVFEYNHCIGPTTSGSSVYFHNGDGIIIRYNILEIPDGYSVYSVKGSALIHNNLCINPNNAISVGSSSKIYNNLFYGFNIAIQGDNLEAINNLFYPLTEDYTIFKGDDITESNNFLPEDTSGDYIPGEAKFTDPDNYDFTLQKESDCIGAGLDVSITNDIIGTSIPQGNSPDIGPYEFLDN